MVTAVNISLETFVISSYSQVIKAHGLGDLSLVLNDDLAKSDWVSFGIFLLRRNLLIFELLTLLVSFRYS